MSSVNRNKPKNSTKVNTEVQKLFRKTRGNFAAADLKNLRRKYSDVELADEIQAAFIKRHSKVTKRAKKFAQLIRERYSDSKYPFHVLLEKALKYKAKHNLSDEEFAEFKRIYEQELVGIKSKDVFVPATNMRKVLGGVNADGSSDGFNVKDADFRTLQEILKLASSSRPLHAQVVLQSMQYTDCDTSALYGRYTPTNLQRVGEHIHPVVAAFFIPKIDLIEQHFLHSNLAALVKNRYNRKKIQTRANYELFYNLINDPNDVVCSGFSPVDDLLKRCNLQNQLWNSVLNLRNGMYFNSSFTEFVSAVDICRQNKNDHPDLVYGRHDGTVLKRLISAFSFRPTVVATLPQYKEFSTNPYSHNIRPMVSSVPMINLKLPVMMEENPEPVELRKGLSTEQLFINTDGKLEYRKTNIIYSRGVIMFYVDRTANVLRVADMQPFSLARLPAAISGFERVNKRPVHFDYNFDIRQDRYELRSVVCTKVNESIGNGTVVIGSRTLIRDLDEKSSYIYDPYTAKDSGNLAVNNSDRYVMKRMNVLPVAGDDGASFQATAQHYGTVFIYQLVNKQSEFGEFYI